MGNYMNEHVLDITAYFPRGMYSSNTLVLGGGLVMCVGDGWWIMGRWGGGYLGMWGGGFE